MQLFKTTSWGYSATFLGGYSDICGAWASSVICEQLKVMHGRGLLRSSEHCAAVRAGIEILLGIERKEEGTSDEISNS